MCVENEIFAQENNKFDLWVTWNLRKAKFSLKRAENVYLWVTRNVRKAEIFAQDSRKFSFAGDLKFGSLKKVAKLIC